MSDEKNNKLQFDEQSQIESEWIRDIKAGNQKAFEMLFNFYCQRLINFIRRYVADIQIAENIVQDVFVHVWNHRANLDPSRLIKSYLFKAVKNEALKEIRHRNAETKSQQKLIDLIVPDIDPEKELTTDEMNKEIHQAINELPDKCREIFKMNRFDGLKYAEIAETLNISEKTVETQMGRAFKKLRIKLKPLLPSILSVLLILLIIFSMSQ
jgi:RNA polymerase sigma-70 factor (ECF subfamily)